MVFFARLFHRSSPEPPRAQRHFAAAKPFGALQNWQPHNWSADALAQSDLDKLRARSRSLARDNDYMHRFLQMAENNIIGREGFILQGRVTMSNGAADTLANQAIERSFERWARRGVCEVSGSLSFADVQRLLIRSVARDGEALVRHIIGFDNGFGYALQVLDIDRLDTDYNRTATHS